MADIKSLIDKFNIFRTKDSILNDVAKDNGQITIDIKQPFSDDIDSNNSLKTKLETNIKDKLFNTEINNVGNNVFDEKIKPFDKGYNETNTPDTDTKTPIDTPPIKPDTPTIEKNSADAPAIQQEKIQQPEITTPKPKQPQQQYKTITEQQNTNLTTDSIGNPMPTNIPKKGTGWSGVGQQQIDDVFNLIKNDEEKLNMFQSYLSDAYNQLKSANLNNEENIIYVPFSYDHENGNMQGITLRFGLGQKEWAEKQLKILEKGITDKQNEEWLSNLKLPEPETTMDKITSNPWSKLLSFIQPPTDGMDIESKRILESGQKENRLNAIKWGLIDNIKECKDILAKYYKDKSQIGTALSQKNIAETINNVIFPQIDLVKQSEIASIISKYKKNPKSLTHIENEIVKYYSDYVNALSVVANKTSTGYETTKAIETSLPFMADFLRFNFVGSATRGGTRTAMKVLGKNAARQIAENAPKTLGARAFQFGSDIAKSAIHTPLSPLTHQNMLEDYSQTIAANGQYTKNDLRRGVIEAFTENFSERMFGALKGIMPKSNNAFVNSLFGNNPVIKSMQKHMNVGGLFEENAEEYAGAFLNTMFGFMLNDEKLSNSFKEQLDNSVPTILSIGITVGLPQAFGMGINFREIRNLNNRFNVAEDNLKQYFNKENSYLDINRYSDGLKSLYINLNNAKNEEDKAEIKGKIAELNKTAANLAMEKGDSNGFNLISEYSIAAQNSFYVTNKAMSELKNMSEEDRTKLGDNAINKLKNDFTNNLNWSLISRAAAKNITDQNGKQHPTCFLYTDNGVTYVLNGQKDNMFYFVDVNGNTISKSADELRNNENLSVLHLDNLLSFGNKELEDINSKFIDIAQYNAGYRYKVNDNGEIRYYTDNKDLINSNTPYEEINRDKIESNLVGSYDLVRIDNITNAVEDMAKAFAEPAAEETSDEQTYAEQPAEQQTAQDTAQETIEQPAEEQPQEPAQEQPIQEQTAEEQETTEQEPIQPAQQQVEPAQQETIQEQIEQTEPIQEQPAQEEDDSKEVSAFDRVKNIIIATAQSKERNTNGFAHLLRSLSDEELNEALEFVNTKKGRRKIDKIDIDALRRHIYYELEERDLSKNLEEAENRGYEYSLKSFENLPTDFDYAGYIINQELQAENSEKRGYKGMAAFKRGLIRAVKKLQMQAAEAKDVNTNPTEAQKKGTDEKEDNILVGDTATSQRGEQGSTRDAATRERTKDGNRTADSAGRGTDEVRTEQQVKSSYVEKQWSENDNVEEMKQRLEYLSKATEIGSKEENEIFPEYKQLEADKKALLEKYNGRVPKEKQDELAIKYKDFLDRLVKLFNEISSLRIAIEEAEEKTSIKAKEQAKQEKLNNIQNSYNGYLKGLSNLVASRLYKALSNKVNISGEVKTIAEFIEEWQKNGNLNVSTRNYKPQINRRRWNRMSGQEQSAWEASHDKLKTAYLVNDYELGKTAYDYANWLLSNKSTQQVQEDKTETKKEVKNKEVTTEDGEMTADSAGGIEAESRVAQNEQANTKSQGEKPNIPKTEEAALRDALIDKLREAGIDVITDVEEAQRLLDEANGNEIRQQKTTIDAVIEARDNEYLEAVRNGDLDKAQRMVVEAAKLKGYNSSSQYQGTSAFNGAAPWGNGYFLTKEERKEALDNDEYDGDQTLGDYIHRGIDAMNFDLIALDPRHYRAADPMRKEAIDNVRNAIQKKSETITMYRSVPSDVKEGSFRNGDWVTPSRAYAVENAKVHGWGDNFNIIEQKVPVDEIWWDGNDIAEWGYGREEDFINDKDFAYKNTKNNRKLLDAVTYDDNGNVIPLSKRFNARNSDIRFFRTADGDAYGFTVGGKIYIDQRIATADTPIHEYSHLWASAMQKLNPKEWENIVKLMKGTPIWEEVKRNYPELTTDNEIADEVLAFYSGSRGAERLREEHTKILKDNGNVVDKVKAINAIKRVREALKRFWKNVAEWFGIHFTTAEEVADKVLSDLLNGVNPTLAGVENDIRFEENSEEADIVARAKADGTYMKAPNGKKSNLSPRQWVQVRTKAFKDWFGDWENDPDNSSKVVDENGEPMVVYHGFIGRDFNIFDKDVAFDNSRSAQPVYGSFFFSDTRKQAEAYGSFFRKGERVFNGIKATFLNIKNPFIINSENTPYHSVRGYFKNRDTGEIDWSRGGIVKDGWEIGVQDITIAAMEEGYDGVIFRNIDDAGSEELVVTTHTTLAVFSPTQIKSSTDNVGTFDQNNPDIRYRRASNRSVISSRFERQAEIQREEKNTKSAANIVLGNANVVLNDTDIFDEQYQNAIDNNLIDENVSPLIDSFGITWGYQLKNGVIVINKDVFVSDILDKRVKDNLSLLISSLMKTNKTFFKEGISFFKKLPIWVLYKNDTKSNEDTIKEIINDILLGNTSIDTNKLELLKQYTVQEMNDILDNATKWFEKFEGISSNMFAGNSISDILDTTLGDLMPKEITTTQEGKRLNWFSKLGIDIRSKLFDSLDWFRVVSDKTKDKTASELYDAMIVHTKRVQGRIDIFDKEYVRPIIDTIQSMLGKDFGNSTLSLDLIQEYFAIKSLLGRTASLYKERFEAYLTNAESKKPPMFDEFKQIYDEITEDEIKQRINEMGEKSSMSILQKADKDFLMEEVRRTLAAEKFVKQYVYSSANTLNQGLQGEQSLGLINEVTNEPYSELYQLLYSDEQSSQTMHSPIEIIEQADKLIDRAGLREQFDFIGNQIQSILNYVNIERFENGLMSSDTFAKRQLMKDFVNQRGENSSEGNLYEITAKQKANEKMKGKDWFNPNSITSIIAVAQTEIATMEKELLAQRLSYFLTNPNNFDVLSQYGMIIDEKETLNEELSEEDRNYIMDKNIVLLYGDRHTDKDTKGQVDKKKINILKRNDDGTFTKVTISFDNKFIGLEEFVKFVNNNFKYEELRGISKAVAPFTAWISRMYTILSPLFPTKNLFKDLMVTPWLPAKELNGKNSQYAIKNFYNAFNNLSFILKMSFTEKSFSKKGFENKLKARSKELFEYYLEYSKQHSIFSIEDQIGALSKENKTLQDIERALSGKENKFIKFTERALLIKFMQHYAELFENLHKFSAYVTLRKLGYGEERSAQIANNATLNYDRSGSIGRQLNAIIPFAKAALGGLYRTNYLLPKYNPKGFLQRVITLAVLGVMQGLMYDPDDDDISEFARKSGMVFGSFLYPLLPEELSIVRPVRALVIVMAGKKSPAYFKQELMESTIDLVPIASDALRGAFSYNPLTNKPEFDAGQLLANTDKMTAVYALAMLAFYINENKNSFGKNVLLNEETNTDKTRYGRTKQDYGLYDYIARLYNSIINGVDIDDRAAMSNKIGKNGERLMTIAKEDVEFVINNYIPFGRLYAYTAEIIYDAVNDKRINKGHIPLIGGLFAQKSFGKDYYLINNIKYEIKDFTNDFSQSQIEDIKTNILDKAGIREGIIYKAIKDDNNVHQRRKDKAKQKMNDAFNVFILDINNVDKKDFTEDEQKFMLKSFLDSPIMKKALSIGEDTLNKHTAKRVERTYKRYKKYNNENIDKNKEDMNEAVKNFKKMLYDKSITEEEFNNNLNSLYEPMFQEIKLRAKFAGYSIE